MSGGAAAVRRPKHPPVSSFRPLQDHEISALGDEEILAYVVQARESRQWAHAVRALQILAWGYRDIVRVRVGRKVPAQVAEDVADAAILRAIAQAVKRSGFRGGTIGELRKWIHTIADRQVVDYWRKQERSVDVTALPEEHESDDERHRPAVAVADDETAAVQVHDLIERALSELNSMHRRAVELYVFDGRTAAEVTQQLHGVSSNNVHKIAERFRGRMREILGED